MSSSATHPTIPDLFDCIPAPPVRQTARTRPQAQAPFPELSSLSDPRLAQLMVEVARELKQRADVKRDSPGPTELDFALQETARTLEVLLPKPQKRARQPGAGAAEVPLQVTKSKAIRSALHAGIPPAQVAKHFAVPLSAVRQFLSPPK